jgi:cupin 2 domain-containing protein
LRAIVLATLPLARGQLFEALTVASGGEVVTELVSAELVSAGLASAGLASAGLASAGLASAGAVRIERVVSFGQSSVEGFWYDQAEDEFVVLLTGAAELEFEGSDSVKLQPGEWIDIPAHVRHRVKWTAPNQPSVWLAVFRGVSGR